MQITPKQAAGLLGISREHLKESYDRWGLTVERTPGGHRRYDQSQVRRLADAWRLAELEEANRRAQDWARRLA